MVVVHCDRRYRIHMSSRSSPVQLIEPVRHGDERGWFAETYNRRTFLDNGIDSIFVQDNHSLSVSCYTLRGLHFQTPPYAQDKLVRCIKGKILDVAVDVRANSPSYGSWVSAVLSADRGNQLFVPVGFAHGFLTLEPNCEVVYKCSEFYAPGHDNGVAWDDPEIGIEWGIPSGHMPELSKKDKRLPSLANFESPFKYDGRPLQQLTQ